MSSAIAIAKNAETPVVRSFIARAKMMPYLTLAQETSAAQRFADHRDMKARDLLVDSHLRQVIKMAMMLAKHGFSAEDLIQEGNLGLIKAVEKFDVTKGFRLTTYANWWIKSFMQEYMLQHRSTFHIANTSKNKKALMLLSKAKTLLAAGDAKAEAVYKKIAKASGCDVQHLRLLQELTTGTVSFSEPVMHDEGSGEFGDFIRDTAPLPEEIVVESDEQLTRRQMLARAVATLTEREAEVFKWRRMVDEDDLKTLETLAQEFSVSRERIRQIEVRAFEKVQDHVRSEQLAIRGAEIARLREDGEARLKTDIAPEDPKLILSAVTEPKTIARPNDAAIALAERGLVAEYN